MAPGGFDDGNDSSAHDNESSADGGYASSMAQQSSTTQQQPVGQPRMNPHIQPRQPGNCCGLDRILVNISKSLFNPLLTSDSADKQPPPGIKIDEAHKTSEGSGSYVTYVIRTDIPSQNFHRESRHRYSDFESLHRLLRKVHPTIVVPPIPDKHTLGDYAARPGKAKDDPKIIEQRKRCLQVFLNRIAAHPILGREHVFHRFLEPGQGWTEILGESGLAHYLKKKDGSSGLKITDSLLKNPDPHFLASEDYTYKFGVQLGSIVKSHKRVVKHLSELAATGSDMGASYNGWSLTESGPTQALSQAIEAVGEAVDTTVSATSQLVMTLEERVTEPLQDYEKLTGAIDKILKWRHSKHVDYEALTDSLVTKKGILGKLESSEAESQRLAAVLSTEGTSGPATAKAVANLNGGAGGAGGDTGSATGSGTTTPGRVPLSAAALAYSSPGSGSTSGGGGGGGGLLATLNSLIDNDPEATRRANISKTRDRIGTLEVDRERALVELGAANEAIQRDLDRFQRDKIHDIRNMLLMYAVANRDAARKAVVAWEEAKDEIAKVDTRRVGVPLAEIVPPGVPGAITGNVNVGVAGGVVPGVGVAVGDGVLRGGF
ncbi:Sorting nexin, cytoplasm-to-vacuole targeting pathway/endosomal sorting [Blyttiomyces sp. JEL0837]|nr:Sorting nexin, cytoplasm-to-vacuole targeting pathway/endosomal sorting [Blyttiomyces sp. JEL0837]